MGLRNRPPRKVSRSNPLLLQDLIRRRQPKNKSYLTVAIDGRGGSGKTTLGDLVRAETNWTVINGDGWFEPIDDDLRWGGSKPDLVVEVRRLRQGIREHRDSSQHGLCWHQPALWDLLPERTDPLPVVPEWPQFLKGCVAYRQSLDEQLPLAPRTSEPYRE